MSTRKHKRETSIMVGDAEACSFVLEPTQIEVGSGYSFCIDYDEKDTPIVNLKTYGTVDMTKVKKEIEKAFPNAQIRTQSRVTIAKKQNRKRKTKTK